MSKAQIPSLLMGIATKPHGLNPWSNLLFFMHMLIFLSSNNYRRIYVQQDKEKSTIFQYQIVTRFWSTRQGGI
jgi:hypothetical protein